MTLRSPRPVRVVDPSRTRVVVVGAGGTGSYVVGQLARLLYGLKETRRETGVPADPARPFPEPPRRAYGGEEHARSLVPGVLLLDGDRVSARNLLRQYYLPMDVGRPKACVTAERYAAAYGLPISALPRYLTPETDLKEFVPEGSIVVACVDNSKTRSILHEGLKNYRHVVYVDAGNAAADAPSDPRHLDRYDLARVKDSGWEGQVLCGVRVRGETVVPFPGDVLPDLIAGDDKLPTEEEAERACGEAVVENPQRHLANVFAATVVLQFLTPLLSDGTLLHSRAFFDARKGYSRSDAAVDSLLEVAV